MKTLVALTISLACVTVLALGGVARESRSAAASGPAASSRSLTLLGLRYAQRARMTGDADSTARAERSFRRALELEPRNLYALTGLGGIALSRHRFAAALELGRAARAAAPTAAAPYGVVGDALLELGRYDAAFRAFDRMAALRPSTSSYARVAYARELRGDVPGAMGAMELALDAAAGRAEPYAWTAVELGKLHWSVGRVGAAAGFYRLALEAVPGYPQALDALARVEVARGRLPRAIALQQRAVAAIPLPAYVAQLGDLHAQAGHRAEARRQYRLVDAIERLQSAGGVETELETALYRVDHGIRLRESLVLARRARAQRPSILGDDVLAWALARNGRCGEALRYSKRSLRLGTQDASFSFHRGAIERCLGHPAEARAWFARARELNLHFSILWAPTARKALA